MAWTIVYIISDACPELESSAVTESEVVAWYKSILEASAMTIVTKQYAVMSLTKLSTRFSQVTGDIQQIIEGFGTNLDSDLDDAGLSSWSSDDESGVLRLGYGYYINESFSLETHYNYD